MCSRRQLWDKLIQWVGWKRSHEPGKRDLGPFRSSPLRSSRLRHQRHYNREARLQLVRLLGADLVDRVATEKTLP